MHHSNLFHNKTDEEYAASISDRDCCLFTQLAISTKRFPHHVICEAKGIPTTAAIIALQRCHNRKLLRLHPKTRLLKKGKDLLST